MKSNETLSEQMENLRQAWLSFLDTCLKEFFRQLNFVWNLLKGGKQRGKAMIVFIPIAAGLVNVMIGIYLNAWYNWFTAGYCFGIAFAMILDIKKGGK